MHSRGEVGGCPGGGGGGIGGTFWPGLFLVKGMSAFKNGAPSEESISSLSFIVELQQGLDPAEEDRYILLLAGMCCEYVFLWGGGFPGKGVAGCFRRGPMKHQVCFH